MAYDRIEPFGHPRLDLQAAVVAAAVGNPASLEKNLKVLFPEKPKRRKKRRGWRALQTTMIAVTKAMGGTIK